MAEEDQIAKWNGEKKSAAMAALLLKLLVQLWLEHLARLLFSQPVSLLAQLVLPLGRR
ncbi:hypothetical protein [Vibrio sp. CAU 1672]|uniref:hypothetical protein n=1 Tax=Vibrio sp. CAU 1672 TaxID=3032594 RepID=UPI0023DA7AB0|nr:hypothetical protein [Vibrio sp. CAU 1672]MDF2155096.1 hypothetical protein [Vibrio sp. CAU 1672]